MRKEIFTLSVFALLFVGCAQTQPDPFKDAVSAEIVRMNPECEKVNFKHFETVGKSTLREELKRKRAIYEYKADSDLKKCDEYKASQMLRNARKKELDYERDCKMLLSLDSLETVLTTRLDSVAYYEVAFSAEAKGNGKVIQFNDAYADIFADGSGARLVSNRNDLHKGMGKALPGYSELLQKYNLSEEEAKESVKNMTKLK